ncbi:MAG: hypothetical protein P1V97_34410, partial [Planctomycetota bacterium]|nr:hypothetical protein [Planctomycetota bacterium]
IEAPASSLDLQALAAKQGLTMAGDLLGTLGYMSPEQVEANTDEQADVFALGAILTEILSGHRAIRGESAINILSATIKGDIKGPRAFDKSCPKELDALACLALRPKKEERLESASALVNDLKAFLAGEELAAYKYGLIKRSQRWVSRHPTWLMAFTLSVLFISSLGYFQRAMVQLEAEKKESERKETLAKAELGITQDQKIKRAQAENLLKQAEAALDLGNSHNVVSDHIESALELVGKDKQILLKAARIYMFGRHLSKAKRILRTIETEFPPAYEALYLLHSTLEAEGLNGPEVLKPLERIESLSIMHGEKNEYTVFAVAKLLRTKRKWREVLLFCKDIDVSLKNAETHYLEGLAHSQLKQFNRALASLDYATNANKRFTNAFYLKSYVLLCLNNLEEA